MGKRIQRKRTRGWRMPEGAVYVGRPTLYGNCFREGEPITPDMQDWVHEAAGRLGISVGVPLSKEQAVAMFRAFMDANRDTLCGTMIIEDLRGKDLACWCSLDAPCHADVLLELANRD